jgi:CheY-like chemotaxis protein
VRGLDLLNLKKPSATILVVDDNADDLELVKIALDALSCDVAVSEFMDGESALDTLRKDQMLPALILLDLKLPGMSGIDTLREIRSDSRLKALPVFIVSSSVLDTEKQAAISTGATGYLPLQNLFSRDYLVHSFLISILYLRIFLYKVLRSIPSFRAASF